jgi:hypothetical protein
MALASFDTLVGVIPADAGGFLHRLDRLSIHNGCAGMGILADTQTFSDVQRALEAGPQTCATELPEVIIDRLPRREIIWTKGGWW